MIKAVISSIFAFLLASSFIDVDAIDNYKGKQDHS